MDSRQCNKCLRTKGLGEKCNLCGDCTKCGKWSSSRVDVCDVCKEVSSGSRCPRCRWPMETDDKTDDTTGARPDEHNQNNETAKAQPPHEANRTCRRCVLCCICHERYANPQFITPEAKRFCQKCFPLSTSECRFCLQPKTPGRGCALCRLCSQCKEWTQVTPQDNNAKSHRRRKDLKKVLCHRCRLGMRPGETTYEFVHSLLLSCSPLCKDTTACIMDFCRPTTLEKVVMYASSVASHVQRDRWLALPDYRPVPFRTLLNAQAILACPRATFTCHAQAMRDGFRLALNFKPLAEEAPGEDWRPSLSMFLETVVLRTNSAEETDALFRRAFMDPETWQISHHAAQPPRLVSPPALAVLS